MRMKESNMKDINIRIILFDIFFNIVCMIFAIYRWKMLLTIGLAASRAADDGEAIALTVGAMVVLVVFLVIDIVAMIQRKKEVSFLTSGYLWTSIMLKGLAIFFIVLSYLFL
ncbi:hypothetical protein ABE547_13950 [Dorea sp. YH-dor226]|uniref:hypothetical protein n=1 Tax=Dorea sp. YH-dor226 TaxID=3151119 RepID=UPI0032420A3C